MSATETLKATRTTGGKAATGRLFFLEASGGQIHSANADGSDRKVILSGGRVPDGIVVDVEAGHIYWTNMGVPSKNDGSIERADLDGKNRVTIISEGKTFTPKQLHFEKKSGKLYWCDREGMRVMRANLDGSNIETLIDTSKGDPRPGTDQTKWCVGITVDPDRGQTYWTQKGPDDAGKGRLFRAKIDVPKGETAANRTDIELLFDGLPEPIDLELDRFGQTIEQKFDVSAISRRLAFRDVDLRAKEATFARVIGTFLRPISLSPVWIDGDSDAPFRLIG